MEEKLAKLDELYVISKYQPSKDAEDLVLALIEEFPKDANVLWRAGRYYYLLAEDCEESDPGYDKKQVKEWYQKGYKYGKEAVELAPGNSDAQAWYGCTIGGIVKELSPKEQIAESHKVREAFLKSIEINKDNFNAQQCYGALCYELHNIGWLARQAATLLFGAPPSETLETGIPALLYAEQINQTPEDDPSRFWNYGYLGMTLYGMKGEPGTGYGNGKPKEENRAAAKKYLERCLAMPTDGSKARKVFLKDKIKPVYKKFQS